MANGVVPPPSRADWFLDPSMGSDVAERRKPSSARYLVAGAAAVSAALIVVALVGPALTDPKSAADTAPPRVPSLSATSKPRWALPSVALAGRAQAVNRETLALQGVHGAKKTGYSKRTSPLLKLADLTAAAAGDAMPAPSTEYKVKVRLYMESQCPACRKFSTTYLKQLMATPEMRNIIDFKFVPWGNGAIQAVMAPNSPPIVLNTTALISRALQQYNRYDADLKAAASGGPVERLFHELQRTVASTWQSINRGMRAFDEMDQNKLSLQADQQKHARKLLSLSRQLENFIQDASNKDRAAETMQARQIRALAKDVGKTASDVRSEHTTHMRRSNVEESRRSSLAASSAPYTLIMTKAEAVSQQRVKSGLRASAGKTEQLDSVSPTTNQMLVNATAFEAWWAAQPTFDFEAWLSNQSAANSTSDWLDSQEAFDFESWLSSQPVFDDEEWFKNVSGGNASLSSHPEDATSLLAKTVNEVASLKKMFHTMLTLGRSQRHLRAEKLSALAQVNPAPPPVKFACQHGPSECAGNMWESCVQDLYPDAELFFPVIDCIESNGCPEGQEPPGPGIFAQPGDCAGGPAEVAPSCLAKHGHASMLAAVQKCVLGEPPVNGIKLEPRSTMLMLENALATEKLSPSRQWVPWLTINDEPVCKTDKDFAQMFLVGKKVCDTWSQKTGKKAPDVCSSFLQQVPAQGHEYDSLKGTPFAAPPLPPDDRFVAPPPPPPADKKKPPPAA